MRTTTYTKSTKRRTDVVFFVIVVKRFLRRAYRTPSVCVELLSRALSG